MPPAARLPKPLPVPSPCLAWAARALVGACLNALLVGAAQAEHVSTLSEADFFDEVPVVLTVTRLAQSLEDTPGAVTVIEREDIARSGARTVGDLLRTVPGYLGGGWNGANPNAAYHAPLDDFGTRNLVLIDGRSVYSPFYLGETHRGMAAVMLEDIERIEVFRGANSAAYGANAMFGVVNIITRHAADTLGAAVSVALGNNSIRDGYARYGWGNESASFRLSAQRRSDAGYSNAFDDTDTQQLALRGDLRLSARDELLVEAGLTQSQGGEGFAGDVNNPERTVTWRDAYLHGRWRHLLGADQELQFSVNYDLERYRDVAPYTPVPGVMLDFSGRGRRLDFELQHRMAPHPKFRLAWGLGRKIEDATSVPLYATPEPVGLRETRLFGNLEWRMHPDWVLNAGMLWGDHSRTGNYHAPRLVINHHLSDHHTLRAGMSRSVRTPSLFELDADVRYYLGTVLLARTTVATGAVQPETLESAEIGYLGRFPQLNLSLDARLYRERMEGFIVTRGYTLPPFAVRDYVNGSGLTIRGLEYRAQWKPLAGTTLTLSQNLTREYLWDDPLPIRHMAPTHTSALAWEQQLPADVRFSAIWQTTGRMTWRSDNAHFGPTHRLDLRLSKPVRVGGAHGEASLTLEAVNGAYAFYQPGAGYEFGPRAHARLRLEY